MDFDVVQHPAGAEVGAAFTGACPELAATARRGRFARPVPGPARVIGDWPATRFGREEVSRLATAAPFVLDKPDTQRMRLRCLTRVLDWLRAGRIRHGEILFSSMPVQKRRRRVPRLYRVLTCSVDGRPVRTSADFAVAVDHGPEILRDADTVVIPPFGSQADPLSDELLEQVESVLIQMRQRTRLVSLCGAAYLLAALGRLDGRPATTHWLLTNDFRQDFPAVSLKPDVLFVDDGDVLTAAGAAAGVDLCLHLVRRDHGAEIANRVARHCVVAPHREGGQRQFIEHAMPPAPVASTTRARQWALDHLDEPLTLDAFAQAACMGVRTFTRRFRQETAMSPNTWLLTNRIDLARRLLETTDLPIEAIAHRSGFGTATGMRQHFRRLVGIPPSTYRRAFTPDHAATATG